MSGLEIVWLEFWKIPFYGRISYLTAGVIGGITGIGPYVDGFAESMGVAAVFAYGLVAVASLGAGYLEWEERSFISEAREVENG